jgi:superfamily II RNA helicase
MFLLFFSPLAPRIQTSAKLLAHHWSEYLSDKLNQPYNEVLSKMAVIFIRRGDKMPEDSFWQKHQRWRNISMYVKGIIDEEKRRQIKYTTIFVMTDDVSVMNSIQEYARDGLTQSNKDESYARQYLHGRQILYNVFAPQSCFNPFIRIGFDQFLVNIQFVTDYASLVVGHTDSNVGRYLEEIIYVNRQHERNVQTRTYVVNAPDSLD